MNSLPLGMQPKSELLPKSFMVSEQLWLTPWSCVLLPLAAAQPMWAWLTRAVPWESSTRAFLTLLSFRTFIKHLSHSLQHTTCIPFSQICPPLLDSHHTSSSTHNPPLPDRSTISLNKSHNNPIPIRPYKTVLSLISFFSSALLSNTSNPSPGSASPLPRAPLSPLFHLKNRASSQDLSPNNLSFTFSALSLIPNYRAIFSKILPKSLLFH